jgi:hypothetical protein
MSSESKATVAADGAQKDSPPITIAQTPMEETNNKTTNTTTATIGVKRQRTIGEMFGASSKQNGPAKKVKLGTTAKSGSAVPTALDTTSFDLVAFQETLSEEEKRLLQLD